MRRRGGNDAVRVDGKSLNPITKMHLLALQVEGRASSLQGGGRDERVINLAAALAEDCRASPLTLNVAGSNLDASARPENLVNGL